MRNYFSEHNYVHIAKKCIQYDLCKVYYTSKKERNGINLKDKENV